MAVRKLVHTSNQLHPALVEALCFLQQPWQPIAKGELVKTVPVTFKAWKRFEDELGMIAKEEIDGEYVPRNTCDDNFWKCIQEGDEVSRVDHEYNN